MNRSQTARARIRSRRASAARTSTARRAGRSSQRGAHRCRPLSARGPPAASHQLAARPSDPRERQPQSRTRRREGAEQAQRLFEDGELVCRGADEREPRARRSSVEVRRGRRAQAWFLRRSPTARSRVQALTGLLGWVGQSLRVGPADLRR